MKLPNLRSALRERLDRIVEPQPGYQGRHHPSVPTTPAPLSGFAVEAWAQAAWADIATRHDIEDDRA